MDIGTIFCRSALFIPANENNNWQAQVIFVILLTVNTLLQNLLDQQQRQRLAFQDKKLLEEYKAENDSLKAPNMPAEGRRAEQADNSVNRGR